MTTKKPTVLVIDDVPDNVQVLLSALKDDFLVVAATNGRDAIDLSLSDHQPDIILLDVLMPDMDGYEVCKYLKADDKTKNIPVIFVTVLDENESELKGLKLGAVDYITKPIIPELLVARLHNHLELKQYRDNLEKMLKEKEELMISQSSNAVMGGMIEMIIHQWRQPLTTISSLANNILFKVELNQEVDNKLLDTDMKKVNNSVQYLSQTMDDFRTFFYSDKNKEEVVVSEVVKKAQVIFGNSFEKNSITISVEDENTLSCETHAQYLLQVYINLIKNAKDALIENRVEDAYINITLSEDEKSVITTITDNAGGISEDIIDKIFEAHFSTKERKNGMGLGLYMSKLIVEKHLNGAISAENTKDGVCFTVSIPK